MCRDVSAIFLTCNQCIKHTCFFLRLFLGSMNCSSINSAVPMGSALFSRKKTFGDLKVMGESGHWAKSPFKYGRIVKMEREYLR